MILEDMSGVSIKQAVLNLPYKTKKYIFSHVNDSFPTIVFSQDSFRKSGGEFNRSPDVAQIDFMKGVSFKSYNDYTVRLKIVMDQVKIQVLGSSRDEILSSSSVSIYDSLDDLVSEIVSTIKNKSEPKPQENKEKIEDVLKNLIGAKYVTYNGGYYSSSNFEIAPEYGYSETYASEQQLKYLRTISRALYKQVQIDPKSKAKNPKMKPKIQLSGENAWDRDFLVLNIDAAYSSIHWLTKLWKLSDKIEAVFKDYGYFIRSYSYNRSSLHLTVNISDKNNSGFEKIAKISASLRSFMSEKIAELKTGLKNHEELGLKYSHDMFKSVFED